jgi:hypothetical protein
MHSGRLHEFDTVFRKAVKRLKSPTSRDFDIQALLGAFEKSDGNTHDLRLITAAVWLANESRALRNSLLETGLEQLGPRLSTLLAVAQLNRSFSILTPRYRRASRQAVRDGAIDINHILSVPAGDQQLDADSMLEAATDAIGSWLWDAARAARLVSVPVLDLKAIATKAMDRYSIQHGIHHLWQQALWEGWHLKDEKGALSWEPTDRTLAQLFDAWLAHRQGHSRHWATKAMSDWSGMSSERRRESQLQRTVIGIDQQTGRRSSFKIGRLTSTSKVAPHFVTDQAVLEASYLDLFLDRSLPRHPSLTCRLLLRAWYVLNDLVETLWIRLPKPSFADSANVRYWALSVERAELVETFEHALSVTSLEADAIVNFLTWTPETYKSLWGAPVVPVPGTDKVCIARSILTSSHPVRRTEIWLQKGGLDDNLSHAARGDSYEARLRTQLHQAMRKNLLLTDARCARDAIPKTVDFGEQIDLLIQLGSLLIVGEVKCVLSPADPLERFNYLGTLIGASEQALRKAALIRKRRDVIARVLGIDEERAKELRVIPLVVTNQDFGASLEIDGCKVIDHRSLRNYLGSGNRVTDYSQDAETKKMIYLQRTLYSTQHQAEISFEACMADPPSLRRFLKRLEPAKCPFPTSSGAQLWIETTWLKDISEEERNQTAVLQFYRPRRE